MKRLLFTTAIAVCCFSPIQSASAQNIEPLKPRIEGNWRYSNDRSIYMSEIWVPLAQNEQDGSVLFGDVRIMGDNNSNNEFNAGVGYREIINARLLGEGIIGGMVWYDRRQTARDSEFNQVTVGGEWLSNNWDVRVNGYLPLNDAETHTQANPNGAGAGFVGNQLLVNTDQTITEEALKGVDLELGYKLSFLDNITDATRIYAGGYHFEGDRAEDVSGWRTRFTSDITSDIQVGARYQHDDVRGSQTYVEATIRLPFGNKKSYQEHGLRSRLDEAPERDIDIVSNEAVIDEGRTNVQLLNAQTGLAQNIIHVDNTNGGAEDGSIDNPYNTLAEAEAVAGANDLIYVHRGDGTTTGMNVGFRIDDAGQMLVGSGADLEFSRDRFRVAGGGTISQPIMAATQAPVITNGGGNGVNIDADNVYVSGLIIDGPAIDGVRAYNDSNVIIENMVIKNTVGRGIDIIAGAADTKNITISNNTFKSTGDDAIRIRANNGFTLENVVVENNDIDTTTAGVGVRVISEGAGSFISNVNLDGNSVTNAYGSGFNVGAEDSSSIDTIYITNNLATDSQVFNGFVIRDRASDGNAANTQNLTSVTFKRNSSFGNNSQDIQVDLDGGHLDARQNWWGTTEGLRENRIWITPDSRTSVDASQQLFSNPNQ